jgi:hypothetical protein
MIARKDLTFLKIVEGLYFNVYVFLLYLHGTERV